MFNRRVKDPDMPTKTSLVETRDYGRGLQAELWLAEPINELRGLLKYMGRTILTINSYDEGRVWEGLDVLIYALEGWAGSPKGENL